MRSPSPPAPMKAATVAVPTLITAAVFTPGQQHRQGQRQLHQAQQPGRGVRPSAARRRDRPAGTPCQAGVGVAHDRQQRVERTAPAAPARSRCGPSSAIRKASSASDGTRLQHAHRAQQRAGQRAGVARPTAPAARRPPPPAPASRSTSTRCWRSQPRQVGREQAVAEARRCGAAGGAWRRGALPGSAAPPRRSCGRRARPRRSARSSCASSMRPASAQQRRGVDAGAHQQHGVVAREEAAVVQQHAQPRRPICASVL